MPLNFPNVVPSSESWRLIANTQTFTSDLNGITQTTELPGARWSASLTFTKLTQSEVKALRGFLTALRGKAGRFYLSPNDSGVVVSPAGLVAGASQTGGTLDTDGWVASTTVLQAGDWIGVNDELKMLSSDATTDGTGAVTLEFSPNLHSAPADNDPITTNRPTAIMRLVDDSQAQFQLSQANVYSVTLECVEALDV